jgi:divalent metal cation (Fe/Co/Zn/Cd) transporter
MIMPWLAAQKRHLSITTGSAALRADAAESAVCGYLALIALAGLAVCSSGTLVLLDLLPSPDSAEAQPGRNNDRR